MKTTTTAALAALLCWGAAAQGQDTSAAPAAAAAAPDAGGTPEGIPAHAGGRAHDAVRDAVAVQDRLRAEAWERMREALAERAALPPNGPELPGEAAGAPLQARDRHRLHEAEAIRAAERHVARSRAGEAGPRRGEGAERGEPGSRMGGWGAGECAEAAGQRHLMEMHGGTMEHAGDGGGMGGMGGHR